MSVEIDLARVSFPDHPGAMPAPPNWPIAPDILVATFLLISICGAGYFLPRGPAPGNRGQWAGFALACGFFAAGLTTLVFLRRQEIEISIFTFVIFKGAWSQACAVFLLIFGGTAFFTYGYRLVKNS
jgi:hypothetical protein